MKLIDRDELLKYLDEVEETAKNMNIEKNVFPYSRNKANKEICELIEIVRAIVMKQPLVEVQDET